MSEIAIYESDSGSISVTLQQETVWLSLQQMAELFARDKSVISRHLRNVFAEGELERQAVVAKNATTAVDGKTYQVELFNLDAVLSVGYRVNSKQGTRFRQWATQLLKEHLTRGYTLNRERFEANAREPLMQISKQQPFMEERHADVPHKTQAAGAQSTQQHDRRRTNALVSPQTQAGHESAVLSAKTSGRVHRRLLLCGGTSGYRTGWFATSRCNRFAAGSAAHRRPAEARLAGYSL